MKRFEYSFIETPTEFCNMTIVNLNSLNDAGLRGWEIVHVDSSHSQRFSYLMKREIAFPVTQSESKNETK